MTIASGFTGSDVNEVLRLVKSLSDDGNVQLSILTIALVTACRSIGIDKEHALQCIQESLNDERELVHLEH